MTSNKDFYTKDFYTCMNNSSESSANIILPLVINRINKDIKSVIDIGCGNGWWLANIKKLIPDVEILGIDDGDIDSDNLKISKDDFIDDDITKLNILNIKERKEKWDLSICLEVIEHLQKGQDEILIKNLCELSDYVLFSGATPGQGGVNHINEQWHSYWNCIFEKNKFKADDFLRLKIYDDYRIESWYRKNTILYTKKDYDQRISFLGNSINS